MLSHPVVLLSNAAKLGGLDTTFTLFRETELAKLIIIFVEFPPPLLIADGDKIGGLWVGDELGVVFFISAEFIPALLLSPCPGFGEILLDFDESDDDDDEDVEGSAGLDRLGIWKEKSSKMVFSEISVKSQLT